MYYTIHINSHLHTFQKVLMHVSFINTIYTMNKRQKEYVFLYMYLLFHVKINANIVKNTKFNVLFIIIDDLRHLPNATVYLPNIQRLAEESVNFNFAYAQQALCAPSRMSIFTGRRPNSLNLYDFFYYKQKVNKFITLPQLFKKYGYDTYSVGKVFHTNRILSANNDYLNWSEPPYSAPSIKNNNSAVCEVSKSKKLKKHLICPTVVAKQPNQTLPDLEILKESIRILKQNNNTMVPFFLAVGFHKPHIPLQFPRKYLDKVPISKVQRPVSIHKPSKMPLVAWHPWMDIRNWDDIQRLHILFPMGIIPRKWSVKIRQNYYAAVLFIDDLIGTLINHVDRKNTIIVVTSDHGFSLGENGLWSKYSNFDVALRVPLIFHIPGMKPSSVNTPVELLDLFPTLSALVGLDKDIPRCKHRDTSKLCFEGKSLVPLMHKNFYNQLYSGHPFAFSQYPRPSVKPWRNTCKPSTKDIKIMGYSVRTDRYRYTEWVSFNNTSFQANWSTIYGSELYDHLDDTNESNNVYSDENYKKLAKRLSNLLRFHVERSIYSFNDW